ncbi:MAG: LamG domain-containing protein [Flavobacteriales bacterium]|nr:LamG domain-containing protein [Flavobacteriales bacterium]
MLTPRQKYEVCRVKSGVALIPIFDSTLVAFGISTRNGNTVVDWGNSFTNNINPVKLNDFTITGGNNYDHTYASAFTGNVSVKFLKGLKDVYSIRIDTSHGTNTHSKLNITDIENFFSQFPDLYSVCIYEYGFSVDNRKSIIKGDLSRFPISVERVFIGDSDVLNAANDLVLNLSNYSVLSKLKYFKYDPSNFNIVFSTMKIIGNLSKLPTSCQYLYLTKASAGSSITYTAGKVWASAFDTLYFPIPLTYSENDALLNDLKNSVTTATGGKAIYLGGSCRTVASNAAVTYLTGLGFTISGVSVITPLKILDIDFQNNFTDASSSALTMVAGAALPTFALSGRKAGEYCAVFNGSQSIKTTTNLPINSDKVTIAFWMKTTQTAVSVLTELSLNSDNKNAFVTAINADSANKFSFQNKRSSAGYAIARSSVNVNDNTWNFVVATSDRALSGDNETKIYINGSLSLVVQNNLDMTGNYINDILFIGQRAGSSLGFNGSLTRLKIYNYPFTPSEVTNLYNSEL